MKASAEVAEERRPLRREGKVLCPPEVGEVGQAVAADREEVGGEVLNV